MTTSVKELREELKRGRNQTTDDTSQAVDGSGADTQGISGSDHRPQQSVSLDIFGSSSEDDSTHEPHNDSERSLNEVTERGGSTDRRPRKSSGSTPGSAEAVTGPKRRAGRLIADDPIPFREKSKTKSSGSRSSGVEGIATAKEEKKSLPIQRGKQASETRSTVSEGESKKQGFKLPTFKEGSVLSVAEAKALEEPLLSALDANFTYVDQYIWYRTQDETQAPVWSDMDNEDLQILCSVLLKRGQKSPAAAATVRAIVNTSTYLDVAMLMGPRFIKTVQVLKAAPKIERPGFMERKRMVRG